MLPLQSIYFSSSDLFFSTLTFITYFFYLVWIKIKNKFVDFSLTFFFENNFPKKRILKQNDSGRVPIYAYNEYNHTVFFTISIFSNTL